MSASTRRESSATTSPAGPPGRLRGGPARRLLRPRGSRRRPDRDQARERGIDVATARVRLADTIARPWTYEQDPRGELELVADRSERRLVGAWAVAPLAGEWIHYAALAIKTGTPVDVLRDTIAQFPTFSEAYLSAVEGLDL